MAQMCENCGKRRLVGMNVSHSNRKTKRVSRPNLQKTKVKIGAAWRRARYCANCLKTLNKVGSK